MKTSLLAAALALAAWSAPGSAQMVRAQDPTGVHRAMTDLGFTANLEKDSVGDPMISSEHQGTKFKVFFYNCTKNVECATVQLHAGYDLEGSAVTLDKINAWNRAQRFGRAYLDGEGDPIIEMDIDLDDGGMSKALFGDNLEFWTTLLGRFQTHIGFGK